MSEGFVSIIYVRKICNKARNIKFRSHKQAIDFVQEQIEFFEKEAGKK